MSAPRSAKSQIGVAGLRLLLVLLALPLLAWAKGADGLVILKGTMQAAKTTADAVDFNFTGELSFSFFTAAEGEPIRRRIDLQFEVKKLPIHIPKFGTEKYDADDDPYRVSFRNAAKHALAVSQSGERVTVALFAPKLSYDINGMIDHADCTHAQVMPDRLERAFRAPASP
jgi:hypothetical protein